MAYNWQQIPRAQTTGNVYEITDTLEWTSPIPDGGTPQDAVNDYKEIAADQTTSRRCMFMTCFDGNPVPNGIQHFQMPSGVFDNPDDN